MEKLICSCMANANRYFEIFLGAGNPQNPMNFLGKTMVFLQRLAEPLEAPERSADRLGMVFFK